MAEAQAARRFRLNLRACREIETGERFLDFDTHDVVCKLFRWRQVFQGLDRGPR